MIMPTSSRLIGPETMYTSSMLIHHGALRNCRTGICNLIFPMLPLYALIGNPKCLNASFFNGKFSSSTSP